MCKISNEELVKLAQIGDVEARELLFENNKGLINKVANARYKAGHLIFDYDDIFQEACIGFNKAIDKFDASKGFKFSTYAMRSMTNMVLRYKETTNSAAMYVPIKARKIILKYGDTLSKNPDKSKEDILSILDISENDFNNIEVAYSVLSLDFFASFSDEDKEDLDVTMTQASIYNASTWDFDKVDVDSVIDNALSQLSNKERDILEKLVDGYTRIDIGHMYEQSDSNIGKIEKGAKKKVKSILESEGFNCTEDLIKC